MFLSVFIHLTALLFILFIYLIGRALLMKLRVRGIENQKTVL